MIKANSLTGNIVGGGQYYKLKTDENATPPAFVAHRTGAGAAALNPLRADAAPTAPSWASLPVAPIGFAAPAAVPPLPNVASSPSGESASYKTFVGTRGFFKKDRVEVHFRVEAAGAAGAWNTAFPGETVRGHIFFTGSASTAVRGATLELVTAETVHVVANYRRDFTRFLNVARDAAANGKPKFDVRARVSTYVSGPASAPAGKTQRWPFELVVPAEAPPTFAAKFSGANGGSAFSSDDTRIILRVVHTLLATVTLADGGTVEASAEIVIGGSAAHPAEFDAPICNAVIGEAATSGFSCCPSVGAIDAYVYLPHRVALVSSERSPDHFYASLGARLTGGVGKGAQASVAVYAWVSVFKPSGGIYHGKWLTGRTQLSNSAAKKLGVAPVPLHAGADAAAPVIAALLPIKLTAFDSMDLKPLSFRSRLFRVEYQLIVTHAQSLTLRSGGQRTSMPIWVTNNPAALGQLAAQQRTVATVLGGGCDGDRNGGGISEFEAASPS